MPTRSIKLKLVVPRGSAESDLATRQAIYATHRYFNECVRYYEDLLLQLRQQDVPLSRDEAGADVVTPSTEWQLRLRQRLLGKGLETDCVEAALPELRALYAALVPTSEPGVTNATAQAGGKFHSPLVDARSKGGRINETADASLRQLCALVDSPEAFGTAARTIMNGETVKTRKGSRPAWLRAFHRAPDASEWIELLRAWVKASLLDQNPTDALLGRLQQALVLPLADPYGKSRLVEQGDGGLIPLERAAFSAAVDHLISFESWSKRTQTQHAQRQRRVDEWDARYADSHADALAAIQAYENEYTHTLQQHAFWSQSSRYRVRPRQLRDAWQRLREWLQRHADASDEAAVEQVRTLQTQLGRDFGSETLLSWLARRPQRWLANHPAGDVVSRIAARNGFVGSVERTRSTPLFTQAEPRMHPRFLALDAPPNRNAPQYRLDALEGGKLLVRLPLLTPAPGGKHTLKEHAFFLAFHGQAMDGVLEVGPKKSRTLWVATQDRVPTSDHDGRLRLELGGASLLIDRNGLENHHPEELLQGHLGAVFLKVGAEVSFPQATAIAKRCTAHRAWLSAGPSKRRLRPPPEAGTRILAVDLGLRTAATYAAFEVTTQPGWGQLTGSDSFFRHVRSFQTPLPGEHPSAQTLEHRREADDALWHIRTAIGQLRTLARAIRSPDETARRTALERLKEAARTTPTALISDVQADALLLSVETTAFTPAATRTWFECHAQLSRIVSRWRRQTRVRRRTELGGKSIWAVEHLERVRKTLISWNRMHPPDQPEVRRLDRKRQGSYAARLLRHLDGLRDDRAKTTADHIVQAARGLAYVDGRWEPRHSPADVIVLEDLARYRFKTDRPRAENSLLMRWSHREVTRRVMEQAEVYGIAVADTGAAFSSRFDAVTGAPGMRCEQVSRATLQFLGSPAGAFEQQRLERLGVNWRDLVVGDVRPRDGGELIVTLDGRDDLRTKHADINAAQNIGVRYLTAHASPVRMRVSKVPGGEGALVSYELGLLAEAALGGKRLLFTATDGPAYSARAFKTSAALLKHLKHTTDVGATFDQGSGDDDDSEDDELAESQALLDAASAEALTLFRDPSGHLFGGMWCEAKVFWGRVRQDVISRLRRAGRLHG